MKRIWSIITACVAVVIAVYGYWIFSQSPDTPYSYYTIQRDTLVEEVVVSGKVQPAQTLSLAFEQSGLVESVFFAVGETVTTGQRLAVQDTSELATQLLEASAVVEAEQAKLVELKRGTRAEEVAVAETKYENTQRSLTDAKTNLSNIKQKAVTDLDTTVLAAFTTSQEAVLTAKNALLVVAEIQQDHFLAFAPQENELAKAQAEAILALFNKSTGGRLKEQAVTDLNTGLYGEALKAFLQPSSEYADVLLLDVLTALQKVSAVLDAVPITNAVTATQKANIASSKTAISNQLVAVSDAQQDIIVQRVANLNSLAAAERQVTEAQNAVNSALDELLLRRAGATPEQIATQEALVRAASAKVATIQKQISRRVITAPISGVVTKVDIENGEVATMQQPVIDIISDTLYEIEARVPEVDVVKVAVGQEATVTLDAYGSNTFFKALVTSIDPAETIIDGVSAYLVTLQFVDPDSLIRSGMTAEIELETNRLEDVLVIPRRLVSQQDDQYIVEVIRSLPHEQLITEQKVVELGLLGSNGFVHIVTGVVEGDKILSE